MGFEQKALDLLPHGSMQMVANAAVELQKDASKIAVISDMVGIINAADRIITTLLAADPVEISKLAKDPVEISKLADLADQIAKYREATANVVPVPLAVAQVVAPKPEFHVVRHNDFDLTENLALEEIEACTKQVKVRNSNPLSEEKAAEIKAEIELCKWIAENGDDAKFSRVSIKETRISAAKQARKTKETK